MNNFETFKRDYIEANISYNINKDWEKIAFYINAEYNYLPSEFLITFDFSIDFIKKAAFEVGEDQYMYNAVDNLFFDINLLNKRKKYSKILN